MPRRRSRRWPVLPAWTRWALYVLLGLVAGVAYRAEGDSPWIFVAVSAGCFSLALLRYVDSEGAATERLRAGALVAVGVLALVLAALAMR